MTGNTIILERAKCIPLYLHAYAFHLNMRYERILPCDLLEIAHQQKLHGSKNTRRRWGVSGITGGR